MGILIILFQVNKYFKRYICKKIYIHNNLQQLNKPYLLKANNFQIFQLPVFARSSWNWATNNKWNSFLC